MTIYSDQGVDTSSSARAGVDRVALASYRTVGWLGIAFSVLFVAGFLAFPSPEDDNSHAAWEQWWTNSGHRVGAVIATYLMIVGLGAFVWFMWSLRRRLRESGPMLIFGSLFVAFAAVSTMVRVSIPGGKLFGGEDVPLGEFSRMFDSIGMALLLIPGALAAGMFVAILSHTARRQTLLPGWLTIAGFVVAALQVASGLFFPFALLMLWVLVTSIVLVRTN
jgi:hypothetical protein